jgi:hypothetical protein
MLTPSDEEARYADDAICSLTFAMDQIQPQLPIRKQKFVAQSAATPKTSQARREASQGDLTVSDSQETVLYLGYGSNLAAETFLGKRGIRPLSQVNVVVPSIHLTFDLPGIPYSEPCFGNCRYRSSDEKPSPSPSHPPYHKNAWRKGLVGVVYEVTKEDYAHIIATEGGGSGYTDVLVDCHTLSDDPNEEVPLEPSNTPFKAHTLYAPSNRIHRPDPDYAQPSARYLKLILDGAQEHDLPTEYRYFLANIRTYHATTAGQQLGLFVMLSFWGPVIALFFVGSKMFARPNGTYPAWFARFMQALFTAVWASYDKFFYAFFGDGERTIEGGDDDDSGDDCAWRSTSRDTSNEKTHLLATSPVRLG